MNRLTVREKYWTSMPAAIVPASTKLDKTFIKSLKPRQRILDLGCGSGRTAKSLSEHGHLVTGIDINEEGLYIARKQCQKARFILARAENLPFADSSFDVVIAMGLLGGVEEKVRRQIMQEINRVLKPGGKVYIAEFARHTKSVSSDYRQWSTSYRNQKNLTGEYGSFIVYKPDGTVFFISHHFHQSEIKSLCRRCVLNIEWLKNQKIRSMISGRVHPCWHLALEKAPKS